jgi:hypothetical protein
LHPANMLWTPPSPPPPSRPVADGASAAVPPPARLVLLDWEVVGLGSGPQELGQFAISHWEPSARRAGEAAFVRRYHDGLLRLGVRDYPWEACWAEYVAGGVGRWVWLLAVMSDMCPDAALQYFADQLAAFIRDHGVTVASVGMPRV